VQAEKPWVSDMTITDAQDFTAPDHKTALVQQISLPNKDTVPVQEEKPLVSDMTTTDAHDGTEPNKWVAMALFW